MTYGEAREKLINQIRLNQLQWKTEQSYVAWLRRYYRFLRDHRPRGTTHAEKMEAFLTHLARHERVAASTQNQAFNAILYFYRRALRVDVGNVDALRARRPKRERQSLPVAQVLAVRSHLNDSEHTPARLLYDLMYGCGLRVSEPLNIRLRDIDLERKRICIRAAKGNKDRWAAIPKCCLPQVEAQIAKAKSVWSYDRAHFPLVGVTLPGALNRKYPRAPFSQNWFWLFPAQKPCLHPRTRQRVRWHLHPAAVQNAVRAAACECGLEGQLTPHVLRHCYATHLLDGGVDVKTVQELMGHVSINTTAGYLHPHLATTSPLDRALAA